jgi:hypothetical protein
MREISFSTVVRQFLFDDWFFGGTASTPSIHGRGGPRPSTDCGTTNTYTLPKNSSKIVFLLPLSVLLFLIFRVDKPIMEEVRLYKWTKLLPANSYQGSCNRSRLLNLTLEIQPMPIR